MPTIIPPITDEPIVQNTQCQDINTTNTPTSTIISRTYDILADWYFNSYFYYRYSTDKINLLETSWQEYIPLEMLDIKIKITNNSVIEINNKIISFQEKITNIKRSYNINNKFSELDLSERKKITKILKNYINNNFTHIFSVKERKNDYDYIEYIVVGGKIKI